MMRRFQWRYLVAGALCCVGLLAAVLTLNALPGRNTISTPVPSDEAAPMNVSLLEVEQVGAGVIVEGTVDALSQRLAEVSLPDADGLASDVEAIMRAWLGGTGDDYLAYLDRNGHEPPPAALWKDPQKRNEAWLDATATLREASFDPSGTSIRTSFKDGEGISIDLSRVTGWRFNKLSGQQDATPSLARLSASDIEIREVLVPMRSKSLVHGAEFNGLLAMSYAQDPSTSQWTLVAVSVYDVPNGDTAMVPPF